MSKEGPVGPAAARDSLISLRRASWPKSVPPYFRRRSTSTGTSGARWPPGSAQTRRTRPRAGPMPHSRPPTPPAPPPLPPRLADGRQAVSPASGVRRRCAAARSRLSWRSRSAAGLRPAWVRPAWACVATPARPPERACPAGSSTGRLCQPASARPQHLCCNVCPAEG